jgi:hypothetical protein
MTIGYASWEGIPTRYSMDLSEAWCFAKAWCFANGAWREVNSADVAMKAAVVSKETFDKIFGELPALPSAAFSKRG